MLPDSFWAEAAWARGERVRPFCIAAILRNRSPSYYETLRIHINYFRYLTSISCFRMHSKTDILDIRYCSIQKIASVKPNLIHTFLLRVLNHIDIKFEFDFLNT